MLSTGVARRFWDMVVCCGMHHGVQLIDEVSGFGTDACLGKCEIAEVRSARGVLFCFMIGGRELEDEVENILFVRSVCRLFRNRRSSNELNS